MSRPERKSEKGEVFSEVIEVGPKLAMDWLSAVPEYQRKVDENQVNKLVMAIHKGDWRVNGATIVFNEKGDLIDGQHRLHAITKSGKTVKCIVVTGVGKDELTFASLGDTKARKAADFMQCKNPNEVAAVLRLMWFVENKMFFVGLKAKSSDSGHFVTSPPVAEIVKLGRKYAEEIDLIIKPLKEASKVTKCGSWIPFLMYYFTVYRSKTEATKVATFFSRVADGVGLEANSPILLLRRRCMEHAPGLLTIPRRIREGLVLKALNLYLDDKKVDKLVWNPDREPFPPLRGYTAEGNK